MSEVDVTWVLQEIQKGEGVDPVVVRLLVGDRSSEVDSMLLAVLADRKVKFDVAELASRILVERDPDRDPVFLHEYFPVAKKWVEPGSNPSWLMRFMAPYPPVGAHGFGFSRLTQLHPVDMYARQLDEKFFAVRMGGAAALGDTADLASLEPLVRALVDPSWRVRVTAADSVRRLRHAGAAEVLPAHPVRDGLMRCLGDRRRVVRVAAARALGSMGDVEPLQRRRASLGWLARRQRRDLDEVLRGEIPPLPKVWPGDETT